MAITLAGLQLIAGLYRRGALAGRHSVMEIGSQDLHPKQDDVVELLSTLVGFRRRLDTVITPEVLYKSLGFGVYKCIDADGRHDALKFDLNSDILRQYDFTEKFDLVTNYGTTEHVFDQRQAFSNMHNLCAHNGVIIHEVPFQRWLNHGLYNYQPTFFYDLANANGYALIGMHIGLPAVGDITPYSDDLAKAFFKTGMDMELLVVLQKTREAEFHSPYNGKYLDSCLLKDGYRTQYDGVAAYEQFFPGPRTLRQLSTTDMNLAPTKALAGALLRRLGKKVLEPWPFRRG